MNEPARRRYGDEEVARILERASELQEERTLAPAVSGGLTADELEGIAAEVGIDRALVRRAMRELDAPPPPSGAAVAFLGSPATLRFERVVPGEVPPEVFVEMQVDIEGAAQCQGQGGVVGRTLRWQSAGYNANRWLRVQVTSQGGETHVLVEERLQNLAGGLFGGIMGGIGGGVGFGVGMGVGLGALGSTLFAIVFPSLVLAGSYAMARAIFTTVGRERHRALEELADRLAEYPRLTE